MHVRALHLENVMSHRGTTLKFPDKGIVLVEGDNGSGKSTLIEAVPAAFWNKTLRGTPPWRQGESAKVQVETDTLEVERSRKGNKGALRYAGKGAQPQDYDTVTKAQADLDALIPTYDTWLRTAVFSSSDAHHFTSATDAERKRLVERLLGLTRFEEALTICRSELKTARLKASQSQERLSVAEARLSSAEARLEELNNTPGMELPPKPKTEDLSKAKAASAEAHQNLSSARAAQQALNKQVGALEGDLRGYKRQLAKLDKDECEACGQEIPPEMHAAQRVEVRAALDKVRVEHSKLDLQLTLDAEELEELAADAEDALGGIKAYEDAIKAYEAAQARAGLVDERRCELEADIEKFDDKVDELLAPAKAAAALVAELEACEKALGMKGVRAQILGSALGGIQEVCNAWLERIFPGVQITLSAQGDRADGKGTVERITLLVEGLDHEYGYQGASQGERRRCDVALLLALAEIAAGAAGVEPGTLFFDEVFDILDTSGVESVCQAIQEIAQDRAVLVISHNAQVTQRLQSAGATRYLVTEGKVEAA